MCSASRVRSQTGRSGTASPIMLFADEGHCELAEERSLPVVAVRQHQDLPIVADLEELLGTSMHRADDDPGRSDHIVLGPQPQLDQPGLAGVFRSEGQQDRSGQASWPAEWRAGRPGREIRPRRGTADGPSGPALMAYVFAAVMANATAAGPLGRTSSRL